MSLDPITAVADGVKSLINLGSEMIEDKDKRNEFNYKARELANTFHVELLKTQTIPWVDAFIKIVLSFKGLMRPAGAAISLGIWLWLKNKGVEMDPAVQAILLGQAPAWGWSRHVEKQERVKVQEILAAQKKSPDWFYDEDLS